MSKFKISLFISIYFFSFKSFSQLTSETISINAVNRTYKQYLPTNFNAQTESVSLVFILHGIGATSDDLVGTGFNNIADTARIIAIYPQGLNNSFGQSSWNNGTLLASTANDLLFMNTIIDSMIINYHVDPRKVYVTGFSMGSIMSYHMAIEMNSRIAAIGAMSGTMATSDIATGVPAYATPVIHFHGTSDGTIPYNTSPLPSLSLVPQTINFWQTAHSCDLTADSIRITDVAADNITIDRLRFENCSPLSSLELWRMNGADHEYMYQPTHDIEEIVEIWLFMRKWTHSSPLAVNVGENFKTKFAVYPNPNFGILSVNSYERGEYSIFSICGELLQKGLIENGTNTINIEKLGKGTYLFVSGTNKRMIVKE